MNEKEKLNKRRRGSGEGPVILSCGPELGEDYAFRKHITRTFGMMRRFGHPDIELFYKFSPEPYHHPELNALWERVRGGEIFRPGDRFEIKSGYFETYTAELREVTEGNETLLRAVILELDQRWQALPTAEALAELDS